MPTLTQPSIPVGYDVPCEGCGQSPLLTRVIGVLNWEPLKALGSLKPLKSHLELSMCVDYLGRGCPENLTGFHVSKGPYKS